jgi:hypothetical protein
MKKNIRMITHLLLFLFLAISFAFTGCPEPGAGGGEYSAVIHHDAEHSNTKIAYLSSVYQI